MRKYTGFCAGVYEREVLKDLNFFPRRELLKKLIQSPRSEQIFALYSEEMRELENMGFSLNSFEVKKSIHKK